MASDHGLRGKTVLITGAAGGIGSALARAFAAQGVRLMLLDRVDSASTLDLIQQDQATSVRAGLISVRAEPTSVRAELTSVRAESTSVRAEPVEAERAAEALRQAQGERGIFVRAELTSVRAESTSVWSESTSVWSESTSVRAEHTSVRAEPVEAERAAEALRQAQGERGVFVRAEPISVWSGLTSVRAEPTSVRAEPISVRAEPVEAFCVTCDLGNAAQVAAVAEQVRERWGTLDVLVNNAGSEYPTPIADAAPDAMTRWASLLDNNVTSMVRLTQALLPLLPRGASVINQSSIWGRIGVAGFSAYAASKHAVVGLTRSLALELGPRGIRVNAVCPGWIRTEAALRSLTAMAQEQGRSEAEVEREILARQAVPEMLTPADIAGVFLFLASSEARSLTGQCLVASHGEVMA